MRFSTKTTYGLRAMIMLARAGRSAKLSVKAIADESGISAKYLERIFSGLKKAGLISAAKGSGGGYSLNGGADKITVHDIVRELEGRMALFHCLDESGSVTCASQRNCGVVDVLGKVQLAVNKTLKDIKLSDLV